MEWITYRLRWENYKNKVKTAMRREGKKVAFEDGTISLKTINIYVFTWYSKNISSRKYELKIFKQIHAN